MTTGCSGSGSSRDEDVLALLCAQLSEPRRPDNGASSSVEAAKLDGARTWLSQDRLAEGTHGKQELESIRAGRSGAPDAGLARRARRRAPWGRQGEVASALPEDAERALTGLYDQHYSSLVRLAALLVCDIATAEAIVQDCFVALGRAQRPPAVDLALRHLRQGVVHRSRSAARHGPASNESALCATPGKSAAEQATPLPGEYAAIISALRVLPTRQREALVLRYYGEFAEPYIAPVMGISRSAVRRHTARATASLRLVLEREHAVHAYGQSLGVCRAPAQDVRGPTCC
jgi:DNA-directed RNA polymerase specialized sigma24 family protein